jgi:hypothetical protein
MGTRGIIAVGTPRKWRGQYHHMDSYPSELGVHLVKVLQRSGFERSASWLVNEHPAGWSTLIGGFPGDESATSTEDHNYTGKPACFCHTRGDADWDRTVTPATLKDWSGYPPEWMYLIDETTIRVYAMRGPMNGPMYRDPDKFDSSGYVVQKRLLKVIPWASVWAKSAMLTL